MTRARFARPSLFVAALALLFIGSAPWTLPASAQSAASVVEQMRAQYVSQFSSIDTYVVETDLYTAYHQKTSDSESLAFRSKTQLKGQSQSMPSMGSPVQSQIDQLDQLAAHARHAGMEAVDGVSCHVLQVDDPSKMDAEMGANAQSITYYVSADDYRPLRITTTLAAGGTSPQEVAINFRDYKTVDGLTLPWAMEIQTNMGQSLSAEQKKQLQQMKQQMEQMDAEQRKMMERMMGDRMKQLEQMMAGEPTVIRVQSVTVNQPLPDGIFDQN